jgi:hypothetical protein
MRSFNMDGWQPIETAPIDTDVRVFVTDGIGDPYALPFTARRTAEGWVSSTKATVLSVTPIKWRKLGWASKKEKPRR